MTSADVLIIRQPTSDTFPVVAVRRQSSSREELPRRRAAPCAALHCNSNFGLSRDSMCRRAPLLGRQGPLLARDRRSLIARSGRRRPRRPLRALRDWTNLLGLALLAGCDPARNVKPLRRCLWFADLVRREITRNDADV